MPEIIVERAFRLLLSKGRMVDVPAGRQVVDPEVADHWFTKQHLASDLTSAGLMQLEVKVAQASTELAEARSEAELARAESERLADELAEARSEAELARAESERLADELATAQAELAEARAELAKVNGELAAALAKTTKPPKTPKTAAAANP